MGLSEWEVRQATARGQERHASYLREATTAQLLMGGDGPERDRPRLSVRRRLMRGLDRLLTWLHVPHPTLG